MKTRDIPNKNGIWVKLMYYGQVNAFQVAAVYDIAGRWAIDLSGCRQAKTVNSLDRDEDTMYVFLGTQPNLRRELENL